MSLIKLMLPPDQTSYTVTDGAEVVSVDLDGGAARYRRDILGATSRVAVQWTAGVDEYKYLRGFYRGITISGSLPFEIDLIVDANELTTHKAYFIPKSFALRQQQGLTYIVGAELEIYPADITDSLSAFVLLYNEFGKTWAQYENIINEMMNVTIPEDLQQ